MNVPKLKSIFEINSGTASLFVSLGIAAVVFCQSQRMNSMEAENGQNFENAFSQIEYLDEKVHADPNAAIAETSDPNQITAESPDPNQG